jgi:hypothetical protein
MTEDSHTPDPARDDERDSREIIGGLRGNLSFRSVPWSPGKGTGPEGRADAAPEASDGPEGPDGPGGPDGPDGSDGSEEPDRRPGMRLRPSRPLVAPAAILAMFGLVIVIALGIVGVVHYASLLASHNTSRSGPTAAAAAARRARAAQTSRATAELASQVHTIVTASASSDRSLQRAVGKVRSCTRVSAAAGQIGHVVGRQRQLVTMAATIDMGAAAKGAELRSSLMSTLRDSLQAGREFLTWARTLESGCRTPSRPTPAYTAGVRLSRAASLHRAQVDALWNPIARQESYPVETASAW